MSSTLPTRPRLAPLRAVVALILGTALAAAGVPAVATAAPVLLYSQNFSSAPATNWTYSGQPWTTSGGVLTANAGSFSNLPALNYALATLVFPTTGYQNVEVRFDYSTSSLAGESLLVNYSNTSGGYSTLVNQSSNVGSTSTGWLGVNATDHAGFHVQFSLVGNGVSSSATVTIDNVEIRAEEIPDSTPPSVTPLAPATDDIVTAGVTAYSATVSDDETAEADIVVSTSSRPSPTRD